MNFDFAAYQDHKINGGEDVLTLAYEEFIAPLIGDVQMQQEKINKQNELIQNLIARVVKIEGEVE